MKHLLRTVSLEFFQDEANGETGLAHKGSIDKGFNAFYNGIGIFHDVFEHWFEGSHKYFYGDAGFNIGGEMVAMGAAWYYYDGLHVNNRHYNPHRNFAESIRATTEGMIVDIVKHDGVWGFGEELECQVPYQRPVENNELEYQIEKLFDNLKSTPIYEGETKITERCKAYKDSVTFQKIANLHRYGYRMAKRTAPENNENRNTLVEFITAWDRFCTLNPAKEMSTVHRGVTFRLFKENGKISWTARFERYPEFTYTDRKYLYVPLLKNGIEIIRHYAS